MSAGVSILCKIMTGGVTLPAALDPPQAHSQPHRRLPDLVRPSPRPRPRPTASVTRPSPGPRPRPPTIVITATENAATASTCSPRAGPSASDTHPTIGAPATQPTYPAAVKVPTALTTWDACRLTVLITNGQNNDAPPAPSARPTAANPAAGATDSNKIPPPATHPPTTNAVRLDIRPSNGPPAPRVVAAINCPTTYAPAPNKTPVARWLRKNSTPHVSTPPSVTSARANTTSSSNNPSRRSRRNGCDVVIRPAPSTP